MAMITYGGGSVEIDAEGYLVNIDDWNENVAQALAAREGAQALNEDMLEVIRFMRTYYKKFGSFVFKLKAVD